MTLGIRRRRSLSSSLLCHVIDCDLTIALTPFLCLPTVTFCLSLAYHICDKIALWGRVVQTFTAFWGKNIYIISFKQQSLVQDSPSSSPNPPISFDHYLSADTSLAQSLAPQETTWSFHRLVQWAFSEILQQISWWQVCEAETPQMRLIIVWSCVSGEIWPVLNGMSWLQMSNSERSLPIDIKQALQQMSSDCLSTFSEDPDKWLEYWNIFFLRLSEAIYSVNLSSEKLWLGVKLTWFSY